METLLVTTFPKRTKGVKRRNLATSRVLHNGTDTSGSPPWQNTPHSERGQVYREFLAKIMEIKLAEINIYRNQRDLN